MKNWEDLDLLPHQVELLERSAIGPDMAHAQGIRCIRSRSQLPAGFEKSRKLSESSTPAFPGLLFRYHSPLTSSLIQQYRPDAGLTVVGEKKPIKYVSLPGTPICPHVARQTIGATRVLIVEGTKQALAAVGYTDETTNVFGLSGCWNWQSNGVPHPQLKAVAGLDVVVAMDADAATNAEVYTAALGLGAACKAFGAKSVSYLRLKGEGATDGLDDILGKLNEHERCGFMDAAIATAESTPADSDPSAPAAELRVKEAPERGPFAPPPVVPNGERAKRKALPVPKAPIRQTLPSSMSGQTIAGKILDRCEADNLFLMVDSPKGRKYDPVYCYQEGAFRVLPETWLCQAIEAYDGAATITAMKRKKAENQPIQAWEANETNISNVNARIRARLSAKYNMAPGQSPLRHGKPIATVFANGTICWDEEAQAMRWEKHNPWHRATWAFDFEYEPGLVPVHALAVLRYSFANCDPIEQGKRVELLRAAAGVAFLGAYTKVRRSVWLSGNGNDGKGVFTNLVSGILKNAGATVATVKPQDLANRVMGQNSRIRLQGVQCNFAHEVNNLDDVSALKSVLQCEEGEGRSIGSDTVSVVSDCSHFFDSNYPMPKVRVDNAWRRRLALVLFENPIPAEYPVDRNIDEKLIATQTRELVCWAIDGALDLLANGGAYDLPRCHFVGMDDWAGGNSGKNVPLFFRSAVPDTEPGQSKTKLPKLKDLYGVRTKRGDYTDRNCYLAWHVANGYSPKDLVPYHEMLDLVRTGTMPGVKLEVSHHANVVRVEMGARQTEADAAASQATQRAKAPALDLTAPFDRGHVQLFESRPLSATEEYEKRPYKGNRHDNVIPIWEDDAADVEYSTAGTGPEGEADDSSEGDDSADWINEL